MIEVKAKLRANQESPEHLKLYIAGFADRLNDEEPLAVGIIMALTLYNVDLQTGKNGFTGEPMSTKLASLPPMVHEVMAHALIIRLVNFFPEALATEIQREWRDLLQKGPYTRADSPESDAVRDLIRAVR